MLASLVLMAATSASPAKPNPPRPPSPGGFAFVNVSVIPMDRERVLSGYTVVVQGDRIVALGPSREVKIPEGVTRIDGTGKFLIPGLAEMHAHIPPGAEVADSVIERVLGLYVLHGVTTVRGMLGDPRHLPYRARAARGELLSPTIYTSSPSLNGGTMRTGKDAADSVTKYKKAGYDFLKIHPGIKRGVFDTIAATAKRVGIKFAGHVPLDVGIERAIETHYWSVDHFDGMLEGLVPHEGAFTSEQDGFFGARLINRVDESRIPALAAKAKAAGVWVVPTETLFEHVLGDYSIDDLKTRPEMRYLTKKELDDWVTGTNRMRNDTTITLEMKRKYLAFRGTLIRGLYKGGVGFLSGSDAPQVWNVPGYSIRRELALIVKAGLTPYQALETGTKNVAVFFGTQARTGTIATGKRADLVLLDASPLTDITNLGKQAGVMVGGRWLDGKEIATRLDGYAAKSTAAQVAPADRQVAWAVEAAPEKMRADATVLGYDAGGKLITLRSGTGDLICLADDPAKPNHHVACYHRILEPFMARGRELRAQGLKESAIDSARAAEIKAGSLKMWSQPAMLYQIIADPGNADPATGEVKNSRVLYVMYIPYATAEGTGLSLAPAKGRPWLMEPGLPWAHVMISP